jgi:hypothetical protein
MVFIKLFVIITLVKELNTSKEHENTYPCTQIPPVDPIMSQINPVYVMYSCKINLNFPFIYFWVLNPSHPSGFPTTILSFCRVSSVRIACSVYIYIYIYIYMIFLTHDLETSRRYHFKSHKSTTKYPKQELGKCA